MTQAPNADAVTQAFSDIPALPEAAPALLTGEYDFSCTPEDTRRTAAAIPGARVTIMEELGHFPMSENPEQFRRYIAPVLAEITKAKASSKQGVHA